MSDISNQLIKDSYNYVLQSDLSTGIVYRIGGGIPVNPKFLSGLTINSNFNYSDGTEQPGFVLITDAFGNATWGPVSGSSSENYLSLSGGTVTGPTIFTGGLTANTFSASTYLGLPIDIRVTGATKSGSVATFRNNTGGTFTLTGLTDTFITGATKSGSVATFTNNTGGTFTLTGLTDVFVTGGTYSSSTGISTFRNNTGGTFTVSGYFKPTDDIYVSGGTIVNGPDEPNNIIILNRSDGNTFNLNTLVNIVNLSKNDMSTIISARTIIRGKTYKISKCAQSLYFNGSDGSNEIYTDIYLMGLEDRALSETGVGVFYTPKYGVYPIFKEGQFYNVDDIVIWGGYTWECRKTGTYFSDDLFTLNSLDFKIIRPFNDGEEYIDELYNIQYDDIIYDFTNDKITYRNEQNSNIVSTTTENIQYWENLFGYNPIKVFQWGNVYTIPPLSEEGRGIGNQRIINSYNENINYAGKYQKDFYFNNLSYQKNNYVITNKAYQESFYFDNKSYQNNISINDECYQKSLYLINSSYQENITFDTGHQIDIILENQSYQDDITFDKYSYQSKITLTNNSYFVNIDLSSSMTYQQNLTFNNGSYLEDIYFGDECYQSNFNFNNGSYLSNNQFFNDGNLSNQSYFTFDNLSYQGNVIVTNSSQEYFDFTNESFQIDSQVTHSQSSLIFDKGSQYGDTVDTQSNITIKNYNRDLSTQTGAEDSLFFIHDLPVDKTEKFIGKIGNQLIEVDGLTYDGSQFVFTQNVYNTDNTLTFGTLSATTYQNLPVSGVTGGTGISASSSNGLVTIVNTSPDRVVTISGGTGIQTGGTYPNFVITNTLPDQIVTISGGTNISVNGTYPNFGINFTGSTGVSGDFLPLSGGTVTGETIFTSGVTANTISATTYQNLPATPFLPLSGGTVTGDTIFTAGLTGSSIVASSFNYTWVGLGVGGIFSYFNDTIYYNETGKTHYFGGGPSNFQNNLSVPNGNLQVSSGLTANTISATTYQNLPVSGVTGGTGISASSSNGLVTIVNTLPDQVVTITGGTNIEIDGTYPNFGINFTGSTGASGDFLPLSGGTVSGATIFTGGLTANTISATTITSPSISPYGLIVATSIGYQNIF